MVYGISFDIQAAYDNVWHDGLLFKLLQSGIRGRIALWFYHFLRDRKAFVSWRGTSSAFFRHDRGVPQGSVISPIMFSVFMHDILELFLAEALNKCKSLELVYSPAHVGIRENEWADSVARDALVSPRIYNFVSPEDAISACSKIIRLTQTEEWAGSKYCNKYTWLEEFNYKKISFSRSSEVLIFRFLSRSLPLNTILYKCRLRDSPNCAVCQTPETWEHFVLSCPKFENARDSLRSNLGCIPLSLDWISDFSFCGRLKSRAICAFLVSSGRF
ncbi:hypothetical protein AVEN_167619-1 [Araneus ventricosus]|uniref:Reverse transcriptase domain-containing protein n=1 Tax=Araneus ventricosus TaxID=182803 RepID=A0A4Y2E5F3_ARAVE|nr:hypothetical protein AVEN_167619-1 [Araneus ventricosus]